MGTIDISKSIKLSGKIGPVIAYVTKDGKQAFRNYTKPQNPRTPKQMAHRAKFALANQALSPLNKIIKRGYPDDKNAYRRLVGKAYHEAVTGDYPHYSFDYGKVQVAAGKLQLPADIYLQFHPLSHTISLGWNPQRPLSSQPGSDNDKLYVVCFNTEKPLEAKTLNGGTRAAGKASVKLPGDWQLDTTHFWIYLVAHDLLENSNSIYLIPTPE